MFYYNISGFHICSEIQLLSLKEINETQSHDLFIIFGDAPDSLNTSSERSSWFEISPTAFLLKIKDLANYYYHFESKTILVKPVYPDNLNGLELFLIGSCLGVFLIKKGIFPFHSGCVTGKTGTTLICGDSGAGKSTLTSFLALKDNYAFLADDISALKEEAKSLYIKPFITRTKLWQDSLENMEIDYSRMERIRDADNKYYLPVSQNKENKTSYEINRILFLKKPSSVNFSLHEIIPQKEKFKVILSNSYRSFFYSGLFAEDIIFTYTTNMAKSLPLLTLERPVNTDIFKTVEYLKTQGIF